MFKAPKITTVQNLWGMKLIFCADKHQGFVQGDTIISDGNGKACLKYSKQKFCNILLISFPAHLFAIRGKQKRGSGCIFAIAQEKSTWWSWFFHTDKHQRFLQVDLASHARSNEIRLQYLGDISRKKLGIKSIFWMEVNIKVFHKLIPPFLTGMVRHVQSNKNDKLAIS